MFLEFSAILEQTEIHKVFAKRCLKDFSHAFAGLLCKRALWRRYVCVRLCVRVCMYLCVCLCQRACLSACICLMASDSSSLGFELRNLVGENLHHWENSSFATIRGDPSNLKEVIDISLRKSWCILCRAVAHFMPISQKKKNPMWMSCMSGPIKI